MKICSKCKVEKPLAEFFTENGVVRTPCKKCKCQMTGAWQKSHPKKSREYSLRYVKNNREKLRARRRRYVSEYPEKARKSTQNWLAKPGEKQRLYKLAHRIRSRIRHALKGTIKTSSSLQLLGCSVAYLRAYLEKQFLPGMTWENYGRDWQIDHIKPCAKFNLSDPEQQKVCFHYSNTQPLWKIDNLKKGAKYGGD